MKASEYFKYKRNDQQKFWLLQTIENRLKSDFYTDAKISTELERQLKLLSQNKTTPFAAAALLLNLS
jgi:LAO/AO transport system kinase